MTVMSLDWNTVTLTPITDATFFTKTGMNECHMTMLVHEDSLPYVTCEHVSFPCLHSYSLHASTCMSTIIIMNINSKQCCDKRVQPSPQPCCCCSCCWCWCCIDTIPHIHYGRSILSQETGKIAGKRPEKCGKPAGVHTGLYTHNTLPLMR